MSKYNTIPTIIDKNAPFCVMSKKVESALAITQKVELLRTNVCTVNIFKEQAQVTMPLHRAATRPKFLNIPSFSFFKP